MALKDIRSRHRSGDLDLPLEESGQVQDELERMGRVFDWNNSVEFPGREFDDDQVQNATDVEVFDLDYEKFEPPDLENDELYETPAMTEFCTYKDLVTDTDAYQWLLSRIRMAIDLDHPRPNIMKAIRDAISSGLYQIRTTRDSYSTKYSRATYVVDWNPLEFCRREEYRDSARDALEKAIVLIGTISHAQVTTTQQYMKQTWPITGPFLLRKLQDTVSNVATASNSRKTL